MKKNKTQQTKQLVKKILIVSCVCVSVLSGVSECVEWVVCVLCFVAPQWLAPNTARVGWGPSSAGGACFRVTHGLFPKGLALLHRLST